MWVDLISLQLGKCSAKVLHVYTGSSELSLFEYAISNKISLLCWLIYKSLSACGYDYETSVDSDELVQPLFKFRNSKLMFGQ